MAQVCADLAAALTPKASTSRARTCDRSHHGTQAIDGLDRQGCEAGRGPPYGKKITLKPPSSLRSKTFVRPNAPLALSRLPLGPVSKRASRVVRHAV